MDEKQYLQLLIQSMRKKLVLLNQVAMLGKEQRELLQKEDMTPEEFDSNVRDKDDLIRQIVVLDAGFDEVYAHIKDLMERDHVQYEEQLQQLRELVRAVMTKDASIRADEQRNYELAQRKFSTVKRQVRELKASQRAVSSYYKTMMRQKPGEAAFLDNKK